MVKYSNPYKKPVGWQKESHRHYLASKGIKTNRYFVRNDLKGNRGNPLLKSLYARGYSNEEIRSLGIPAPTRAPSRQPILQVPDAGNNPVFASDTVNPVLQTLPVESVPIVEVPVSRPAFVPPVDEELNTPELPDSRELEQIKADEEAAVQKESLVPGNVLMTPGVPEVAPYGFSNV